MTNEAIMIDIESLGTGDHAAILQIGAVRFDWTTPTASLGSWEANIKWGTDHFGNIEPDTLRWWLDQDSFIRKTVFDQSRTSGLYGALQDLFIWMGDTKIVWANSPTFDLRLLRQAAERCGLDWPVKFWNVRDMRTLVKEFGDLRDMPEGNSAAHNALADARWQAAYVTNILRRLRA